MPRTRRELLVAGAAAALAAPFVPLGGGAGARGSPNVLVIVVDTLRADHVYGDRARTPSMDSLIDAGLSFTRAVPEAMPTVPARNAILSGRRGFPFRGWHDYRGLMNSPGWFPLREPQQAWTSVLRRAGYFTGYVTDNPFLGFSYSYEDFRRTFDLFYRRGGQVGGTDKGVSDELLRHWLYPALRSDKEADRVRRYLANGGHARSEADTFAGRVFRSGVDALERAAMQRPFALVVDTFAPHEPWTPPRRYLDMYGDPDWRGPEPGTLRYGRVENWLGEDEAPSVLKRLRALYAAEVTMTDRWIGVLLERLHELGLEEDTVIVLVGDHGIFIGERGWTGKISVALHPELVRVPLVIVDPARRRRRPDERLSRLHARHRPDAAVDDRGRPATGDGGRRPLPALSRPRAAEAPLRIRGLRELALPAQRSLDLLRRQPHAQSEPLRPPPRPGRAPERGEAPSRRRARAPRESGGGGRRPASLLPEVGSPSL